MSNLDRRWLRAALLALSLTSVLAAGRALADVEATASNLRFAPSLDGPWQAGEAVFEGAGVEQVVIAFDYDEASGERYELTVVAPGGLPVHSSRQERSGSGVATATVDGAGIYRDLTADLHETLRTSRTDADRLATARFGVTEFILQLQANATRASSALEILDLVALPAEQSQLRSEVRATVERFSELTAEARGTDPSDLERVHELARQMAERLGQGMPSARALSSHGGSVQRMPIPATDRGSDQPYDVLVSVDDFAAVSGEFRVFPPATIFLPRLSQRELTRP